ncbi:MAG: bifunctional glutamate N-acetyltransferase/amino-acid acetyltransferase ArgJ [Dehalococcoidia bacterium]
METSLIDVPDGTITTPRGFLAGAIAAGMRADYEPGRLDLGLVYSERSCAAAGAYTKNTFRGPPVLITERHLANGRAQAIIANSGVSNSLLGEEGMRHAVEMAQLAGEKLDLDPHDVVVASTGVTGWRLPIERIGEGVPRIILSEDGGDAFAHAIMTTDLVAKQAAVRFDWDGVTYAVGGTAKGSGMIHPDMATMLAFLTTDAPIEPAVLAPLLTGVVDASFNMLTIDGDTSPNDTVVLLANGAAGLDGSGFGPQHPALPLLRAAVQRVAVSLTRELARDGEGASKLLEVTVEHAARETDARRAAKAIAGSLLVKTAVFGGDPNWGRILVAFGNTGVDAEEKRITLRLQDVEVYRGGAPVVFDNTALARALAQSEVRIRVDLGIGDAAATAWGCDLTPEYVRINSEYTT